MFVKLLTPVILWVYEQYKKFYKHKNYEIIYRSLEYTIDPHEPYTISSDFWAKEEKFWGENSVSHYVDITRVDLSTSPIPENVSNCVVCVKYYYNNRVYKFLNTGIEYSWPPRDSSNGIFLPITRAVLMNNEGEPVRDVSDKIRRYAGPRSNFYGETVPIQMMFTLDSETMEKEYPYLVISNALGEVKAYKTNQSVTFVAK